MSAGTCFTAAELAALGTGPALLDQLAGMEGQTYREVKTRRTFRFEYDGRAYFAKLHYGVGWREIFKNLFSLRLPVVDAANELLAIRRLEQLGVPTMDAVAFATDGFNPASRRSAIITRELNDTLSLEDVVLRHTLSAAERRRLVDEVARLTRLMHEGGVNHRDLYICHFHLKCEPAGMIPVVPTLFVIDLHRAQVRRRTPDRWRVKDVGGLFFSAFDAGLSIRDCLRFVRRYSGKPARRALSEDAAFWRAVVRRALKLYQAEFGPVPRSIETSIADMGLAS